MKIINDARTQRVKAADKAASNLLKQLDEEVKIVLYYYFFIF